MKTLRGLEAEQYIKEEGYGYVSKKFLENLFITENFVDSWKEKVPYNEYYVFMVNDMLGDAFLEDIYECEDDVDNGIQEQAAFGIENLEINIDKEGKVYVVGWAN